MSALIERVLGNAAAFLDSGITVSHLNGADDLRRRMKINSGTHAINKINYQERARVPNQDWRDLTDEEFGLLSDKGYPDEDAKNIYLWRLPESISSHIDGFRDSIRQYDDISLLETISNTPHFLRGQKKLVDLAVRAGVNIGTKAFGHHNCRNDLIVTSLGPSGLMVGLHIDSWFNASMTNRSSGLPNRMCVNLGPERRFFMFMNLPLPVMREMLGRMPTDPVTFPVEFMEAFPDYPVVKLEVGPGEAYIAPTEIIIHDATTIGKEYTDATFTILGNFDRTVISNILADTQV